MEYAKESIQSERIFGILSLIFCCVLVVANILAQKTIEFLWFTLPASILIYPLVYIVNDALSDVFGFKKVRRTIFCGFAAAAIAAGLFHLAIVIPGVDPKMDEAFATALGNSGRILFASFASYLCGSLLNSYIMTSLKKKYDHNLFFRCVFSTFIGEGVDSIVFISVAFIGIFEPSLIITMICSQVFLKTLYEIVFYPATKKIIAYVRKAATA